MGEEDQDLASDPRVGTAYLIHFARPVGNARGYAQHYTGWARDLNRRLGAHRGGWGSNLMGVVFEQQIPWELARTWPGVTREHERRLKKSGSARRYCPVCGVTPRRPRNVTLTGPPVVAAPPAIRHIVVRTAHPDWLDKFVQELGAAVVVGAPDYAQVAGGYVVRVFPGTSLGLITFGIVCDGYGDIVEEIDPARLHRYPALARTLARQPSPAPALSAAPARTVPAWVRGLSPAAVELTGHLLTILSDAGGTPMSTAQVRQALDGSAASTAHADPVRYEDMRRQLHRLARLGEISKVNVEGHRQLQWRRQPQDGTGRDTCAR